MKKALILGLLQISVSASLSAQSEEGDKAVQPQLTLSGWYNFTGLDFSIGFGADHRHWIEAALVLDQNYGEFAAAGPELPYHYRAAKAGNGELYIGLGASITATG